jgi:Protein of unknown function (DUF3105)
MLDNLDCKFDEKARRGAKLIAAAVLLSVFVLFGAACGGGESAGGGQESSGGGSEKSAASGDGGASEMTTAASGERTGEEAAVAEETSPEEAELARAEVGKKEITNMIPADGEKPDKARPLPENPPEGIEVYPATTNRSVKVPIEYERQPPTNGDHAPIWLNCGFYEKPVQNRFAVHSMDHGVVWITYRPDLPPGQVDELRSYGEENYVIVSPYSGQDAPVIATSWRVQLGLDGAGDPRLRKFVDGFRVSEIAPLSGNRCVGGVGRPAA